MNMHEAQTIREFLENPIGKGTSILPNRQLIIDDLERRRNLMLENKKKIEIQVYHNPVTDNFFFHVKIPSETKRDNNYDIVIQLSPPKNMTGISKPKNIGSYTARFFSNSPNFIYTYAHIMDNNDLIIRFLKKKISNEVFRKEPVVRNPTGIILYEKSLIFSILSILEDGRYSDREYLKSIQKNHAENLIFGIIRTDDKILEEIKKENKRLGIEKKEERDKIKKEVSILTKDSKSQYKQQPIKGKVITAKKSTGGAKSNNRISAKKSTRK